MKEADDRYSIILLLLFFVNHIYIHVGSLYRDDLRTPRNNILTGEPTYMIKCKNIVMKTDERVDCFFFFHNFVFCSEYSFVPILL